MEGCKNKWCCSFIGEQIASNSLSHFAKHCQAILAMMKEYKRGYKGTKRINVLQCQCEEEEDSESLD